LSNMEVLRNGLLFGFALAFLFGPVFFALIQTSIHKGFKSGAAMAVGISLSDVLFILVSYIGISQIIESDSLQAVLSIAGGGIMLAFGLYTFRKPVLEKSHINDINGYEKLWKYTVKGFLLNGINPFVLLFWLAIVSYSTVEYQYSGQQAQLFFGTIVATVLITDIIKSYAAHRLRCLISEKYLTILNRVVGVALMAFAARLFYSGLAVSFLPF
jgi:threonine/homoserine/homoserine lactone efflux protein